MQETQIQETKTKLSREEIIRRLELIDGRYHFINNRIYFKIDNTNEEGKKGSITYHLGRFKDDKPEVQFDSKNPSQIIYVDILYNRLRKIGVDDVLNVRVTEEEISHIKISADTLERTAGVLEFQMKTRKVQ